MIVSNTLISIASALILGLLLIFVVPLYLIYLDYESYALIGISIVLISMAQIFDLGFHQIIMRKTSLYVAQKFSANQLINLYRSIEIALTMLSLFFLIIILNFSEFIISDFLNVESIEKQSLNLSIILIFSLLILKSFYGIYRGGLQGLEKFKWISYTSVFYNVLRYVGGFGLLAYWQDVNKFFILQLIISLVEIFFFRLKYLSFFQTNIKSKVHFSLKILLDEVHFSKSLTYISIIWVLLLQLDKFILMKFLPLEEFGHFTTLMILSTGILSIAIPFGQIVISKLTLLSSDNEANKLKKVYGDLTQLCILIFLPIIASLAIFSWELIYLLTSDITIAKWGELILVLLLIGNFFSIIGGFQYYLQISKGDLRLQSRYSSILLLAYIPVLYFLIDLYGVLGAAFSWLIFRAITFFIWMPFIHKKLLPGGHWSWFKENIVSIILGTMIVILIIIYNYPSLHITSKVNILYLIFFTWLILFMAACISSSYARRLIFK
jgi:O-antigen/teichoic acid export membrane protein